MSEYSNLMDECYTAANNDGKDKPDTAWLTINGVWWPNPHYKGEPVPHPEDLVNTSPQNFNPPLVTEDLRTRYLKHRESKKENNNG